MWPKKNNNYEIVTIGFSQEYLCLAWISRKNKIPTLTSYRKIHCTHLELHEGTLYNPTALGHYISQFLQKYTLHKAFVNMWLTGNYIHEQLIKTANAHPTTIELGTNMQKSIWDFQYVYPTDNGHFVFYVTGIPKEILFQYQLLAVTNHINLITITTYHHALLHLYHFIQGAAFRHSQLAHDIQQHGNRIEFLFTPETILRVIRIHPGLSIDITKEFSWLLGITGLYIMEAYT
ncbi:hypothetical protein KC460_04080 [Candidatus Dependentiae bacterium]|nr:hypothetical protein [Candidatus Dependentiae bacterium]